MINDLAANNPVSTRVGIPPLAITLIIGKINYNENHLFSSGKLSQLFSGTFGKRSVAQSE